MSDSIKEQIAQAVETQLATINAAAGYETDVESVQRPAGLGRFDPADRRIILHQGDRAVDEDDEPYGHRQSGQIFNAICFVRTAEDGTAPIDNALNNFEADVEKAAMVDPQWGSLAEDTSVHGSLPFDESFYEGYAGVAVVIEITYRTDRADPYSQ